MKTILTLALALTAAVATPAQAGTTIFSGNTAGAPTYNRPLSGRPPTGLSAVGTAVRYVVTPFTVSLSGNYNFVNTTGYDSYLGIHRNFFNPANGLQNAVAYDDDSGPGADSAITALGLLSGVSYFAVNSGFANSDFGAFRLTVDGPGTIRGTGVPEPTTWAMLIFGFAGIGGALRHRRGAMAVPA